VGGESDRGNEVSSRPSAASPTGPLLEGSKAIAFNQPKRLGSLGGGFSSTATTIGAIGFGNDVKNELISFAGKGGKLSPGAAKYLNVSKSLGVFGGVVTSAYSSSLVYDQYQQGGVNKVFQHRDVLDSGVGAVGLGAGALATFGLISNPVGWAIGAGVLIYGGATLIYDAYNEP
jgi:hypothetical protein